MDQVINRKLHAIAGGIAPGEAHEFLKNAAMEKFGVQYRDLSSSQCRTLMFHLREVKERLRNGIYQALNGAEGSPISEAQISQARTFQKLLGWSDHYLWKMINDRYNETSLEAMPKWKAVRLVAYLEKRWHTKQKKEKVMQ
ncbi:MAG: hypothetical protein HUU02_03995 [Bacteroidetes bacterium]|nr:hypothetical protein [Bacteroidota bacterium]